MASDRRAPETVVVVNNNRKKKNRPPDDDCCPICFGDYTVPCKTSCGHWFCASCILKFWSYSCSALRRCKCPICSRRINKLKPEASLILQQNDESIKILEKVRDYNNRFGCGARRLPMKARHLAAVTKTFVVRLLDSNRVGAYIPVLGAIATLLGILYKCCGFNLFSTANWKSIDLFDSVVAYLAVLLCLWMDRRRRLRVRRRRRGVRPVEANDHHQD